MKRIISISEISDLLSYLIKAYTIAEAYDLFCEELESAIKSVFSPDHKTKVPPADSSRELVLLEAATLAFANKVYYQVGIKSLYPKA